MSTGQLLPISFSFESILTYLPNTTPFDNWFSLKRIFFPDHVSKPNLLLGHATLVFLLKKLIWALKVLLFNYLESR